MRSVRRHRVFALVLAAACALPALASAAPDAKGAADAKAPAAAPAGSPRDLIVALTAKLDERSRAGGSLAALHAAIGTELRQHIDFDEMGRRALGDSYTGQSEAEQTRFREFLAKMVEQSYVKRFKPGRKVEVTVAEKVRTGKGGRAQVKTQIRVGGTRADVAYSLHPTAQGWKIYDIVVDEASQLSAYRKAFRKIVAEKGWKGLIERMEKSAAKGGAVE